jgi:choline-glycine betaine transporter
MSAATPTARWRVLTALLSLALLFTGAAFDFVNLISSAVYVVALPFAAVVVTYLYADLRVRERDRRESLPPVPGIDA